MLTAMETRELEELARPLMAFMRKHFNPHTSIIVDGELAEVIEGQMTVRPAEWSPSPSVAHGTEPMTMTFRRNR